VLDATVSLLLHPPMQARTIQQANQTACSAPALVWPAKLCGLFMGWSLGCPVVPKPCNLGPIRAFGLVAPICVFVSWSDSNIANFSQWLALSFFMVESLLKRNQG